LVYAALGLYDRMIHLEKQRLVKHPDDAVALRRLVWALLRDGRLDEAPVQRVRLESIDGTDAGSRMIIEAARWKLGDGRTERIRSLPLLSRIEARELTRGYALPEERAWPQARRLYAPSRESDESRRAEVGIDRESGGFSDGYRNQARGLRGVHGRRD